MTEHPQKKQVICKLIYTDRIYEKLYIVKLKGIEKELHFTSN